MNQKLDEVLPERKQFFQVSRSEKPKKKVRNRKKKGELYVTPFNCGDNKKLNEEIFSPEHLEKIKLKDGEFNSQAFGDNPELIMKSPVTKAIRRGLCLSAKKKQRDSTWSTDQELSFLSIVLIFLLFKKKINFRQLQTLIPQKTYKQIIRHYQSNKKVIDEFSKFFFSYFNCEEINGVKVVEYTLGQLFIFFKNNIMDKNFTLYFNQQVQNWKCIKYFQRIYKYITFEPKYFIANQAEKGGHPDNININMNVNENTTKNQSNLDSKCNQMTSMCESNKSKLAEDNSGESNKSNLSYGKVNFKNKSKLNRSQSNLDSNHSKASASNSAKSFKQIMKSYSKSHKGLENKSPSRLKFKNVRIKMDNSSYEKFQQFSSNAKNLIIDNNFIFQFLISQFKSNSTSNINSAESKK